MQSWMDLKEACGIVQILHILILNMKPIKLQCISSVELKDESGASRMKNKLGKFCF